MLYPEPPDPTEKAAPRGEPVTLPLLDRLVHVSAVLRLLEVKRYRPAPLRPFKPIIDPKNPAFRTWLEQRKYEMFD